MNEELFKELTQSVREGGAILRGKALPSRAFVAEPSNIKRLRSTYELSQHQFAILLGVNVATLRNWEQGRRAPEGPARVLLQIAASRPDVLLEIAQPTSRKKAPAAASRKP